MRLSLLYLVAVLALLGSPALAEEEPPITVTAELDRAFITIGEPTTYTVTIRRRKDVKLLSRIDAPSSDVFKIRKIKEFNDEDDDFIVSGRRFELTTYRLGDFILDSVRVEYRVGGGNVEQIETNRIFLTVESVAKGEEKTDIRGVKGTTSIPRHFLWLIILIVLVALLAGGYFAYRKFHKTPDTVPPETILSAEEEALNRLSELFDSDLIRRGKVKEYYFQLSEILRLYLERRYTIMAVELTTFEIMREFKAVDVKTDLRAKISEVLEAADLAKFAKWKPEAATIVSLNKMSKEIINESRPVLTEPAEAEQGAEKKVGI
ncbi:MAG: hypothetical protein Q8R76_08535 [Candidatus Omnitrophota bacterium]|nr:hypothetical protein [Candidatus Omnitrophota bacterium]